MAVAPFLGEIDFAIVRVEMGAVTDQLPDAIGRFADDHVDNLRVAEPFARSHRVGRVALEVVDRIEDPGNAPLRIGTVGLQQTILGDDDHIELGIDGQRRADAGDSAADDQHIGKKMRNPLGIEPDEIAAFGNDFQARTDISRGCCEAWSSGM